MKHLIIKGVFVGIPMGIVVSIFMTLVIGSPATMLTGAVSGAVAGVLIVWWLDQEESGDEAK